jgi:rhamnogalacturonyl hydrolase YesR
MKKIILLFIAALFLSFSLYAQDSKQTIENTKRVADEIIAQNIREFKDSRTGKTYTDLKGVKDIENLIMRSDYTDWDYTSGVMNMAMLELGNLLKEEKYINYAKDNFEFIFRNAPYLKNKPPNRSKWSFPLGQFYALDRLDDCGAMGASLIKVYQFEKRPEYLTYIKRAADHIEHKQERLGDGTLCRPKPLKWTIWADDLYMSVPFLVNMGVLSGDNKYFDDAAKQVIQFTDYLWDENSGLYYHCWQSDDSTNGVAHWGRANGWVIVAQIELLKNLPENHPQRGKLLSILNQQINGIARWQSESGLWHQLLDKPDSYLESSCTAMFTYGIAAAVNEGWIPEKYISIALQGWQGLLSKTTDDGKINDICIGTGVGNDLNFYYNRPAKLQDSHGTGAYILAGVEIEKYLLKKEK